MITHIIVWIVIEHKTCRVTLLLLVCIVGCSQAKDSDNHVVQDYSEEYEVSPYG